MATKYTKWPQNIPTSSSTFSIARPSEIYPNRDLWFENMPAGNPGLYSNPLYFLHPTYLLNLSSNLRQHCQQGDQIGQIFVLWGIVYFVAVFRKSLDVTQIFRMLFSKVKVAY
jgi:hypothetical protein